MRICLANSRGSGMNSEDIWFHDNSPNVISGSRNHQNSENMREIVTSGNINGRIQSQGWTQLEYTSKNLESQNRECIICMLVHKEHEKSTRNHKKSTMRILKTLNEHAGASRITLACLQWLLDITWMVLGQFWKHHFCAFSWFLQNSGGISKSPVEIEKRRWYHSRARQKWL